MYLLHLNAVLLQSYFQRIEQTNILKKEWLYFCRWNRSSVFSTDTATVLRAVEIEADVILSAKSIDGVYDSDPAVNPDAKKFDEISIDDVVNNRLGVIDLAAAVLCMENHMPMMIFGLNEEDSIVNTVNGVTKGTLVTA